MAVIAIWGGGSQCFEEQGSAMWLIDHSVLRNVIHWLITKFLLDLYKWGNSRCVV